jgi:SAM-dependent methyltransferase
MEPKDKVRWIYSSRDNQELAERYDQWAREYDQDLESAFGWLGPQYAAEYLEKYVPKDARILDAGAGTGLTGKLLFDRGYRELAAMDISQGMLEQARRKTVYKEFHQMVMGEPLGFPSDCFDAVVSVGALTLGHAPASSLDELVRITRPGGYVIFTLRTDVHGEGGFKERQDALAQAGQWTLVEKTEGFQALPKGEPDVLLQVWVYQTLASDR